MTAPGTSAYRGLRTGREILPAMLKAIGAAQKSIQLATYIYTDGQLGRRFLEACLAAARRGAEMEPLPTWLRPTTTASLWL